MFSSLQLNTLSVSTPVDIGRQTGSSTAAHLLIIIIIHVVWIYNAHFSRKLIKAPTQKENIIQKEMKNKHN